MPGLNQFGPQGDPFRPLHGSSSGTPPTVDLDASAGPPLTNIAQGRSILEFGSVQWVHVQVITTDAVRGNEVDPTQYAVELAITKSDPSDIDWQEGTWLTRTAKDGTAGTYAMIVVGPGEILNPGTDTWRVYVRLTGGGETLVLRSTGLLKVE